MPVAMPAMAAVEREGVGVEVEDGLKMPSGRSFGRHTSWIAGATVYACSRGWYWIVRDWVTVPRIVVVRPSPTLYVSVQTLVCIVVDVSVLPTVLTRSELSPAGSQVLYKKSP